MNSDFKELLKILLENQVEFMIIGGYAVIRYTEPRYTKDLDILINPTKENARKVIVALKAFGAPLYNLSADDLTKPGTFFQIGVPPNRVDIIVKVEGIEFEDAISRSEKMKIENLSIPIVGINDLIQNKLAAGRPQDLVDASSLTKAKLNKAK